MRVHPPSQEKIFKSLPTLVKTPPHSPHKLKLPIRRYKGDAVLSLELAKLHALVELAVVYHHDRLAGARRVTVRVAGYAT